MNEQCERN